MGSGSRYQLPGILKNVGGVFTSTIPIPILSDPLDYNRDRFHKLMCILECMYVSYKCDQWYVEYSMIWSLFRYEKMAVQVLYSVFFYLIPRYPNTVGGDEEMTLSQGK